MNLKSFAPASLLIAALLAIGLPGLSADTVVTRDGSRLVGRITRIDAGKVYITTRFAGDLTVNQAEVVAISTTTPVSVRLTTGTRIDGVLSTRNGALHISGADGAITTTVARVADSWPAGAADPAVTALERHWKYEATMDVEGTSGNKSQLGTAFGFGADLAGPDDDLSLYSHYNRQVSDGTKSADQFKSGIDYTSNFGNGASWFVRDEAGFDRIMDITFFETAAAGFGYDMLKTSHETLTGRIGLAYRYDGYSVATQPTVSSAAADFEINHDLKMPHFELVNKVTLIPALSQFSNYNAAQDSYFQFPLNDPAWKVRMGLANTYDSLPPAGIKKLDTTYYTKLILDFQ